MSDSDRVRMTLRFPTEVVEALDRLAHEAEGRTGRRPSHNEILQNLVAGASEAPLLAATPKPRDISAQHAINAIRVRSGVAGVDERGDVGALKLIARDLSRSGQDRAGAVMFAVAASLVLKQSGPVAAAEELLHTAKALRVRDAVDGPIGENVELRIALAEYALELDPENASCRVSLGQWKLWAAQVEMRTGDPSIRARRRLVEVIQLFEWSDPVLGQIASFNSHAGYAQAMARLELAVLDGDEQAEAVQAVAAALGKWAVHPEDGSDEERARWVRQVRFLYQRSRAIKEVAGLLESVRRLAPWKPVELDEIELR